MTHHHDCPGCSIVWECDLGKCMNSGAGYCDICWIVQERKMWVSIRQDIKEMLEKAESNV